MPILRSKRLSGTYRDSVFLMKISQNASRLSGARRIAVMMGTPRNKEILGRLDLATEDTDAARPDELVIAIEAEPHEMDHAFAIVQELLDSPARAHTPAGDEPPRSLEEALLKRPDASLALVSVPGDYARYEAAQALTAGLDVLLYSGDISPADERSLKKLAASAERLLMGPDCGTAIISHVPLGFANTVRRGSLGIVSSSGTGIQEVSCLLDRCGLGISSAYGTGGRDLDDEIGGLSALAALSRLRDDPKTSAILVVGKDIGEHTRKRLRDACAVCGKPVLACYLGVRDYAPEKAAGILCAEDLTTLARMAAHFEAPVLDISEIDQIMPAAAPHRRGFLRGIYSGGALCREAAKVALPMLAEGRADTRCSANFFMHGCALQSGTAPCAGHGFVDMGSQEFTSGRPHPLLNPAMKMERIVAELCDPDVSVVLTDIVLGSGVAPDQAAELVRTRDKAAHLGRNKSGSRGCSIVTSVCGTDGDPGSRSLEVALLQNAGIFVATSNAWAARIAAQMALGGTGSQTDPEASAESARETGRKKTRREPV